MHVSHTARAASNILSIAYAEGVISPLPVSPMSAIVVRGLPVRPVVLQSSILPARRVHFEGAMAAELWFPVLMPALLIRSSKAGSVIAIIAGADKYVVLELGTGW